MPANSTDDRRQTRKPGVGGCVVAGLLLSAGMATASEQIEPSRYEAAVAHCRSRTGLLAINQEKSIFCFDGEISKDRDVSALQALSHEGLFVVRSPGGSVFTAVEIATLLEAKKATVVIYDYCFSACASFFFVAGPRTYVLKDTIVAWHYGWRKSFRDEGTEQDQRLHRAIRYFAGPFYARRIIDPKRFDFDKPPMGARIATILRSTRRETGATPDVSWTWNPRYYKSTLRTEVIYEKYPESQEEVDALMHRFLGKQARGNSVLHDP